MKFRSADQAMRAHLRLVEAARAPRGFDPYEDRRLIPVEVCPGCKKSSWRWEKQEDGWRCNTAGCGLQRPSVLGAILRGTFTSGPVAVRGGRVSKKGIGRVPSHSATLEMADLGLVWKALALWEFRALAIRVHAASWDDALELARKHYPRKVGGWSTRGIRSLVRDARQKAERRMVALGMMDRADLPQ